MDAFSVAVGVFLGLAFRAWAVMPGHVWRKDDTNAPNGKSSGLAIFTDHKTGVQYVGTQLGGLTPRVDNTGRPLLASPSSVEEKQ